jgi:glycosyltransferase involved in cell wall biosynthesis
MHPHIGDQPILDAILPMVPVHDLAQEESLGLRRGATAVCISAFGTVDLLADSFASVLANTEPEIAVVLVGDADSAPRLRPLLEELVAEGRWPRTVHYLRQQGDDVRLVRSINAGLQAAAPADVIVLLGDCIVGAGWAQALRAAAYSESRVVTASALSSTGTMLSVPFHDPPGSLGSPGAMVNEAGEALRSRSPPQHPDTPTCAPYCVYIRRSALELVGSFDTALSPDDGPEVDFAQRCLLHGLRHVVADDVLVVRRHDSPVRSGDATQEPQGRHHAAIEDRYPYYDAWLSEVREDRYSPLTRRLVSAAAAIQGTSVTIDGRCLTEPATGPALATLELIAALDAHTNARLRVLAPPEFGFYASQLIGGRPQIEVLPPAELSGDVAATDIAHRPYQISSAEDALLLRRLGQRTVVTQHDTVDWRTPGYFQTHGDWRQYRRLVAATLASADQVIFASRSVAQDARILGLVDDQRISVVPEGTDRPVAKLYPTPSPPESAATIGDRPFLLCLGGDLMHQNRPFAIRLLEALTEHHGFLGHLVLAGPRATLGSSAEEEAAILAGNPTLAGLTLDLGAVTELEKRWLLAHAAALVHPTTYDGSGLLPLEAAISGTPCAFAWHTSLSELFPQHLALIVPWNARETAVRVNEVLAAGAARDRIVSGIRMAGASLTWTRSAHLHADVYSRALATPPAPASAMATEALEHTAGIEITKELGERYAAVPEELQRAALAVANRPVLRRSATTAARAGYRLRRLTRKPAHDE